MKSLKLSMMRGFGYLAIVFGMSGCPDVVDGWPRECPSPLDERVEYAHATWEGRDLCRTSTWVCPEDAIGLRDEFPRFVENDCGCGCYLSAP